LLWQLLMTSPNKLEENIGSLIVGNLNQDGYLDVALEEIVRITGAEMEKVEEVLALIQTFDPIGVAARNLSECLMIQARRRAPRSG
jgi:RNA polymerase sigma-54 factor